MNRRIINVNASQYLPRSKVNLVLLVDIIGGTEEGTDAFVLECEHHDTSITFETAADGGGGYEDGEGLKEMIDQVTRAMTFYGGERRLTNHMLREKKCDVECVNPLRRRFSLVELV